MLHASAVTGPGQHGTIVGVVSSGNGIAQMGATVLLFNSADRLIKRVTTNERGAFGFDTLPSGLYSIRVTLASFLPAMRDNIRVLPGVRSFLAINLASVLSSIELVYSAPGQGAIMNDDWKWVLRSSMATRPVLRVVEAPKISSIFSDTRGVVRLSAGDGGSAASGSQPDLGTEFALATSVFGANRFQFSGNLGFGSRIGTPAAGFSTRYSRDPAAAALGGEIGRLTPEVELTMRQVFLPARAGYAFISGSRDGTQALRTLSATVVDRARLTDELELVYGAAVESVMFLERLNYYSPFARANYNLGVLGTLSLGASSGTPAAEFYDSRPMTPSRDFQQGLSALAAFPRLSLRDGRVRVQRAQTLEVGYQKRMGSRSFGVAAYRESVANAALTASGDTGVLPPGDVLPDLFSHSSVFNIGDYKRLGLMATVTQNIGESFAVAMAYGSGGSLQADGRTLPGGGADELRAMVRSTRRHWASARVSGTAPVAGTNFTASYLWTDYRTLAPAYRPVTQPVSTDTGLNLFIRQPIPTLGMWSGRVEASAEMRNLLQQGYLPLQTSTGRRVVLIQSPRAVRGGLSFIF